ncbi:TonB-dependent receptor [Stenotrophomonas rhizophila]|uniref:TonB-dependent receptor n=1 Tax=Stenotrophomonas rhizophila TaxID=216778 RepID=UPI0028AEDD85|nr:TonB-dependent receptor [Stenotrophomonas rhizophila]MDY0956661.1 TonB-dependent receptor [Stenotrophomonas rhizophila]
MLTRPLTIAVAIALCAANAHAADVAANAGPDATVALSAQTLDTVSVIGQGETRQVQRIGTVDKQVLPPGTSGQKILDRLPGVSVQSNDAFGANEESQSITLRGFDKSRLGYTLDGIPLGDNSYGNYNGLSIARALIAENLAGAELSQGIGSLGVASTSNLGGTIQYFSQDPSTEFGGRASVTVGDDNQRRGYLRVDTGDLNGFSAYVSGVHQDSDMWAAPHQNQTTRQFNAKAVWNVGDHRFGAFAATSRVSQANYAYLSKDMLRRGLGYDWNIYAPDWDRAVAAAYCAPGTRDAQKCAFSGGVNSIDDAYYQSRALRDDNLYALDADLALGDTARLKLLGYHHENRGQGHWWAPGQPSYPGTAQALPISIRSTNYTINRQGITAALSWQWGIHELEAGLWYERNDHNVERNFYYITGPFLDDAYLNHPDRRLFDQDFDIRTRQFYVQDRMRFLDDRLTVDVGIKSPNTRMTANAKPGTEASYASGTLTAKESVLPQAGIGFKLSPNQELFASYSENIAAFVGGGSGGPLQVSPESFAASAGLEPEKSKTLEAGFRTFGEKYQASIAAYHVMFDNRLLSLNPCTSIEVGTRPECITRFINVGSVKSRGAELTFILKPVDGLQWYNALSWNKTTYEDNYTSGGAIVPVAGKITVDTPQRMASSEISWNRDGFFASLRAKYTGKRYYTYTNDQSVAGVTTFDAGVGYSFGPGLGLRDVKVSLNATNLTNKRYAGQLSSFAPTDPTGTRYAIHASAPRQVFMTVAAEF